MKAHEGIYWAAAHFQFVLGHNGGQRHTQLHIVNKMKY